MKKLKTIFEPVHMELACGTDEYRPSFGVISFKDGYAYATDGHIVVKNKLDEMTSLTPEEIEKLNGKQVSANNWKELIKADNILITDDGVQVLRGDMQILLRFSSFKLPDIQRVIEDILNAEHEDLLEIGFNTNILSRLFKSMCCPERDVRMCIAKSHVGVVIKNRSSRYESMGIIMPVILNM
jgi:hypothetical protein